MSSTWITFKLAFVLFPSTLLGTLPVILLLAAGGTMTAAQAALCVMLSMSMVTSLAKLIARFWDVSSGEIRIGGVKISDMPLSQLADTVSFVTWAGI